MKFFACRWGRGCRRLFAFALAASSLATDNYGETSKLGAPKSVARPFVAVNLGSPRAIAVDGVGTLYVVDVDSATVHKITPTGEATVLQTQPIKNPFGVTVDRAGAVFISDDAENAIYKIGMNGGATSLAKSGDTTGFSDPTSVAVDADGNVFVADNHNNAIRKITPGGVVSTFAGMLHETGSTDGAGKDARFHSPRGIAIDSKGNLYIADEGNSNIRKITPSGVVSTLAGTAGTTGRNDGTGAAAQFAAPRGLAADAAGNIYIADTDNHTIRKITPAGIVSTLAGYAGERGKVDATGATARFDEPRGVAVDAVGDLFVADSGNAAVRKITPDGAVTTVAGAQKP